MRKMIILIMLVAAVLALWAPGVFAEEKKPVELTLQQAIERAQTHSNSVKIARLDTEKALIERRDAFDLVTYTPSGAVPIDHLVMKTYTGMMTSDTAWQMAGKGVDIQKDAAAMEVKKYYYGIIKDKENIKYAEKSLEAAQQKMKAVRAFYGVGMAGKTELVKAESDLSAARTGYMVAVKTLSDDYIKFNQLVGLNQEDRPVLKDLPRYSALVVEDVDRKIKQIVDDSPSVFLAKKNEFMAETVKPLESKYQIGNINHEKSEIGVAQAKEGLTKNLYGIYYNIMKLEEQYSSFQDSLKTAEEDARVALIKFELGMITKAELLAAQAAELKIKLNLLETLCSHIQLKESFEKPWASSL